MQSAGTGTSSTWRRRALAYAGVAALIAIVFSVASPNERPAISDVAGEVRAPVATATPDPPALGSMFGALDAADLYGGLVRLHAALHPTPTPTPSPTPTPTPVPTATPATQPEPPARPAPASRPAAPSPAPSGCPERGLGGEAAEMLRLLNAERAAHGLAPLAANGCVTYIAQLRAEDMARRSNLSHSSPDGTNAFTLLSRHGVALSRAAENIAMNTYPPGERVRVAVDGFMTSGGHRANVLGPFSQAGVGVAVNASGYVYFSVVFVA